MGMKLWSGYASGLGFFFMGFCWFNGVDTMNKLGMPMRNRERMQDSSLAPVSLPLFLRFISLWEWKINVKFSQSVAFSFACTLVVLLLCRY